MTEKTQARRYKLEDDLTLTYNHKGWALIGNGEELIASDKMNDNIKVAYKNNMTMLEFIEDIIRRDLGTPAN